MVRERKAKDCSYDGHQLAYCTLSGLTRPASEKYCTTAYIACSVRSRGVGNIAPYDMRGGLYCTR
jgi:hypothetical protein